MEVENPTFTNQAPKRTLHHKVSTSDADAFAEEMGRFAPGCSIAPIAKERFHFAATLIRTPRMALFQVEMDNARVLINEHPDYLGVTVPLGGVMTFKDRNQILELDARSAHVLNPDTGFDLRTPKSRTMLAATLSTNLLNRTRSMLNGKYMDRQPSSVPVLDLTTPEGAAYRRQAIYCFTESQHRSPLFQNPRMVQHVEETLAGALIMALDAGCAGNLGEAFCPPRYLRHAMDLIHATTDEPLSLAKLSQQTGVNARTLTRAFKKTYGKGPIACHRDLRLANARAELLAAGPEATSVTEVAMKHGFDQLSHFAKLYRQTYGELPSETLRHRVF